MKNALIESFNERLRDDCLNVHQFASLAQAQAIIEAWRVNYNQRRPHSSLGHLTQVSLSHNVRDNGPPKPPSYSRFTLSSFSGDTSMEEVGNIQALTL